MKPGFLRMLFVFPLMIVCFSSLAFSMEEENQNNIPVLSIEETAICRDVVDREPVGVAEVFPSDVKKLYCFTRIAGADRDTEIIHNWYFEENLVSSINLHVKPGNWRTYSSKTIMSEFVGDWKVEILSSDGILLQKIYFLINN
ncbi:MAG: DUF2914 domain-containing protein [Proteobacteria bacterium]|nr:DUF2914 domain-containing protein [Pseudomonadota bacterium]